MSARKFEKQNIIKKLDAAYGIEIQLEANTNAIFFVDVRIKNCKTNKVFQGIDILNECSNTGLNFRSGQLSLLVQSDPGQGKTSLAKQLYKNYRQKFIQDHNEKLLPMYVNLPACINSMEMGPNEAVDLQLILHRHLKSIDLSENDVNEFTLLLLFDGYDECQNISIRYGKMDLLQNKVQIITFSRPDGLPANITEREFLLTLHLKEEKQFCYLEFEMLPFSYCEIENYVRQYCENSCSELSLRFNWNAETYKAWLSKIPDLMKISGTPLLLSLILPALPRMVEKYSAENGISQIQQICSTQASIFDEFTEQWFEHQSGRNAKCSLTSKSQFQRYCAIYSQNLAIQSIDIHGFLKDCTWNEEETLNLSLLEPVRDSKLMATWDSTKVNFASEMSIVKEIRNSCLLSFSNGKYQFFHRSIAEYFAAKEVSERIIWIYNAHINEEISENASKDVKFIQSPLVIHLAQRVKCNKTFRELLLDIVHKSAEINGLDQLASKAITILNAAQFNFSGRNFADISVPYADMSGSICCKTNFRGANLKGVNFRDAYLANCRLEGANLSETVFGEELPVKMPANNISNLTCYHTLGGNFNLLSLHSTVQKYRPGKWLSRNDQITVSLTDFDTGRSVKSFDIGKFLFSVVSYELLLNERLLVVWPYNDVDSVYQLDFDLQVWNLTNCKSVSKMSIHKFFSPVGVKFTDRLAIDKRGKWIVMKLSEVNILLINQFTTFTEPVGKQARHELAKDENIHSFKLAPTKDILLISCSQYIQVLTLKLFSGQVVVDSKMLVPQHGRNYVEIFTIDSKSNFFVFGKGSCPYSLKLYDLWKKQQFKILEHPKPVDSVVCNCDSTLLAILDYYCKILIVSVKNAQTLQYISRESVSLCFHMQENLLASSIVDELVIKFYVINSSSENLDTKTISETVAAKTTQENISHLAVSSDGCYLASLHFNGVDFHGELDKRNMLLKIWKMEDEDSPLSMTLYLGTFLGPGITLDFSNCNNCIVLGIMLHDLSEHKNHSDYHEMYYRQVAEPVALIYNTQGELVNKQIIEHCVWKNLKSVNYRSALFFKSKCAEKNYHNLATALWDGSIQLWKFENLKFVKTYVLNGPQIKPSDLTKSKYVDALNSVVFKVRLTDPNHYWVHSLFLTFSSCGNWVINNNINNEILLWSLTHAHENENGRNVKFQMKIDSQNRPLAIRLDSKINSVYRISPQDSHIFKINKTFTSYKIISDIKDLKLKTAANYEHFNWIICGDDLGFLRIWHTVTNRLLLEIKFWFPIYALTIHEKKNDTLQIIFGGYYRNLLSINVRFNLEWELCGVLKTNRTNLMATNCNISQSLKLRELNTRILARFGAKGQPASLRQEYYSIRHLFREMSGTASAAGFPSLVKSGEINHNHTSNDIWIVSLVFKNPKTKLHKLLRTFGIQHLFIVLEGSINTRKFAIRADLKQDSRTGNVIYKLESYGSFSNLLDDMKNCTGMQWQLSPRCGRKLISNIRQDQQLIFRYNFYVHNCITWCHGHLKRVGIPISYYKNISDEFSNSYIRSKMGILIGSTIFILFLAILLNYVLR